jgi:ABC-type nitrate/sulfonate/bicarbonate transport system substrate-binding protein
MKWVIGGVSVALVLAMSAACGGSGQDEPASAERSSPTTTAGGPTTTLSGIPAGDAPDTTTIALVGASLQSPTYSAFHAARGTGGFDQLAETFATSFEYLETGNSSDALTALLSGEADLAIVQVSDVLAAAVQGRELVATPSLSVGSVITIIGPQRYEDERGTDLSNYDGARVGYTTEGSVTEFMTRAALDAAGVGYEGVALGSTTAQLSALEAGRVDLSASDHGTAARAVRDELAYLVVRPGDFPSQISDVIGGVYAYTAEFAETYPEFVDAIAAITVASYMRVVDASSPAEVLELFPQDMQELYSEPETWGLLWGLVEENIDPERFDGGFSGEQLDATVANAVDGGRITQQQADELDSTLTTIFDDTRTDRAYEILGLERPTAST